MDYTIFLPKCNEHINIECTQVEAEKVWRQRWKGTAEDTSKENKPQRQVCSVPYFPEWNLGPMSECEFNLVAHKNHFLMKLIRTENVWDYYASVQSHSRQTLQPHGLQHARPPCPSPTPEVYSYSCPLSQWCHPTISSVMPFSSHLQSFPASRSFPMSQFLAKNCQVVKILEFQLQHQSFQWIFRTDFL